jgi:hypothetical protein
MSKPVALGWNIDLLTKQTEDVLMNHHHRKVLHALFAHPVSANIAFKDVQSVLRELGAEITTANTGKIHVVLNGHSANFSHFDHSVPKTGVAQIRKFIESSGIEPERDYPI